MPFVIEKRTNHSIDIDYEQFGDNDEDDESSCYESTYDDENGDNEGVTIENER